MTTPKPPQPSFMNFVDFDEKKPAHPQESKPDTTLTSVPKETLRMWLYTLRDGATPHVLFQRNHLDMILEAEALSANACKQVAFEISNFLGEDDDTL